MSISLSKHTLGTYVFPMAVREAFGSKRMRAAHAASHALNQVFKEREDVKLLEIQSGKMPKNR